MSTLAPAQSNLSAESSDDEGCRRLAGSSANQLDNSRVSAMYLRNHGDAIHEALDVRINPTTFSEQRGRVEVLRTPNVKAALEWYKTENADVPFDVFNCSWDDLFGQMARAKGDHEAKVGKGGNWFRYLWRKAGSKSEAVEPWLQLIPDEYGLSIVRGAIGIVFHMAQKSREKEEVILNAFQEITDTIHNAMSKGVSFQREPEMHQCCQALYDCLVEGIADLIWSLKPEVESKNFIDRMRQKHERKKNINIDGMLRKVKTKSDELNQCAERIMAKKTIESHQGIGGLKKEAVVTRAILVDVKADQNELLDNSKQQRNDLRQVGEDVRDLGAAANQFVQTYGGAMREIIEENREMRRKLRFMTEDRAQILSAASSQNATIALLTETVMNLDRKQEFMLQEQTQLSRDIRRSLTPTPMSDDPPLRVSPSAFIKVLDVPLKLANDDLHTALYRTKDFNSRSHQQAQSLLATREFGFWLNSRRSELLLVDGNDSTFSRAQISPMSLLSATLSAGLERSRGPSVIVLHFFCGLHLASGDPVQGPGGLMRALLVQLAAALVKIDETQDFDFGHSDGDELWRDLQDHQLSALGYAFRRLLAQVPGDVTVVCLVDGVSNFEQSSFQDDLTSVVGSLYRLVSDRHRNALFKVLLTSAYRSIFLAPHDIVDREDHVVLEGGGGRGGRSLVTETSVVSFISTPERSTQQTLGDRRTGKE